MRTKSNLTVNTLCVFLTLLSYRLADRFLEKVLDAYPSIQQDFPFTPTVLVFASSIGIYIALYRALTGLYWGYLEDFFVKKSAFSGQWGYILKINDQDSPRVGLCVIEKIDGSYGMSGTHFHPDRGQFTSTFHSLNFEDNYPTLQIRYAAQGIRNKELDRSEGFFILNVSGSPPSTIHGFWADVIPSRNTGSITLMRVSADVRTQLGEYGYPLDSSEAEAVFRRGRSSKGVQPTNDVTS